jgi:hypothetical protein
VTTVPPWTRKLLGYTETMHVAWEEQQGTISRSWMAAIGPCILYLEEVSPSSNIGLWTREHRDGETLYEYKIYITTKEEGKADATRKLDGFISDDSQNRKATEVKAKVVELARRCPDCKHRRRVLEEPPAELLADLRTLTMALITDAYVSWWRRNETWRKENPGRRSPHSEPVISAGYLIDEFNQRKLDSWWHAFFHRRRAVVSMILRQLVKEKKLAISTAIDPDSDKEVKAYSPITL